jgi:hypothetical protein
MTITLFEDGVFVLGDTAWSVLVAYSMRDKSETHKGISLSDTSAVMWWLGPRQLS